MKNKYDFKEVLPTGEVTRNINRYIKAYNKLVNVFKKVWPDQCKYQVGYGPGVTMGKISLSSQDSIALYEALTKKKYTC